jgi:hypothetical protein
MFFLYEKQQGQVRFTFKSNNIGQAKLIKWIKILNPTTSPDESLNPTTWPGK